jgi:hypothetical protein
VTPRRAGRQCCCGPLLCQGATKPRDGHIVPIRPWHNSKYEGPSPREASLAAPRPRCLPWVDRLGKFPRHPASIPAAEMEAEFLNGTGLEVLAGDVSASVDHHVLRPVWNAPVTDASLSKRANLTLGLPHLPTPYCIRAFRPTACRRAARSGEYPPCDRVPERSYSSACA